jgi:hypothetical protein
MAGMPMASPVVFPYAETARGLGENRYRGSDDSQPGNYYGVQIRMVAGFMEITETKESSVAAA